MQIRINLLPAEYRKREMTPLATLLPILGTLTIVLGAGAFWSWMYFGNLGNARTERDQRLDTWKTRAPLLKYSADLKAEESDYDARESTILDIAVSRVPWTKKLDQMSELIAEDDGGERFLVHLEQVEVKPAAKTNRRTKSKKKDKPGETIRIQGLCFSSDGNPLQKFNYFHESIKQSEFFREDFLSINNPAGQTVVMDDDLLPKRAWTVDNLLVMKAREAKKKKRKSPARMMAEQNSKGGK